MTSISRRHFLQLSAQFSLAFGLANSAIPSFANALEALATGRQKVLWLQAQSCSGCSISLLDAQSPGAGEILTRYISLLFHHTLSAATGSRCLEIIDATVDEGGYLLVVEGSLPGAMPEACMMGEHPMAEIVGQAARRADAVIALGTCAAFAGIPGAEGNPTGAISIDTFLQQERITTPLVAIPGCPSHPDWFVGTLAYLSKWGMPPVDDKKRPQAFFARKNHDQCPRFSDYERENFAQNFSEPGCLFKLGCLGVNTYADCTLRDRNGGINSCIKSGSPCIGCASPQFAHKKSLPFYRLAEEQ